MAPEVAFHRSHGRVSVSKPQTMTKSITNSARGVGGPASAWRGARALAGAHLALRGAAAGEPPAWPRALGPVQPPPSASPSPRVG